jgi:uncharacterized OB-fold protein
MAVPARVALVDLDEGVRIVGRLEPLGDDHAVGAAVELAFADDPAATLPVFRSVSGPQP